MSSGKWTGVSRHSGRIANDGLLSSDAHGDRDAYRDTNTHADAYRDTNTHADAYRDTNTHADAYRDTNTHADTDRDTNTHADTDRDTNTHADAYRDTNTHADAYRDTNTHADAARDADACGSGHLRHPVRPATAAGVPRRDIARAPQRAALVRFSVVRLHVRHSWAAAYLRAGSARRLLRRGRGLVSRNRRGATLRPGPALFKVGGVADLHRR